MALQNLFVFLLVIVGSIAEDYCGLCQNHIACNNDGKPSHRCHKILELTDDMKQQILDIHNKLRNQQASGKTHGYASATRMGTMQWDDELAKMAYYNVARCYYGHDECRNTPSLNNVGQNFALEYIEGAYQDPKDVIDHQVNGWFSENKNCDMSLIKSFNNNGKAIGHFVTMVRDSSDRIGCAMSQFVYQGIYKANYLICNYAMAFNFFFPIYDHGAIASKCQTGLNPQYPALCSENEVYDHSTPTIQLTPDGQLPPGFQLPPGVKIQYE